MSKIDVEEELDEEEILIKHDRRIKKRIDGTEVYNVYKANDIDYDFRGKVIKKTSKNIELFITYDEMIRNILSDKIIITETKRERLYDLLEDIFNKILLELSDEEWENEKNNMNKQICFDYNNEEYPCKMVANDCKLLIKKSTLKGVNLKNKIIWKFIELLIITNNNPEIILQDKLRFNDINNCIMGNELLMTKKEYEEGKLDDLFKLKSKFIFTDYNVKPNTDPKNVIKLLRGIPQLIKNIFGNSTNVILYTDEPDNDFFVIQQALLHIDEFSTITINNIRERLILKRRDMGKLNDEQNERIMNEGYRLEHYDLELLSEIFDVGFVLFTSKYNKSKKHDMKFVLNDKYNNDNVDKILNVNMILLYHNYIDDTKQYNLSHIMLNNKIDKDLSEDKLLVTFTDLVSVKNFSKLLIKTDKKFEKIINS